jgi:hypothetical protein
MVVHREKRCSNASSRGIESDRSTIQFTRATQLVQKVERGRLFVLAFARVSPSSARRPVQAATSQMLCKAHLADPRGIRAQASKGVCVRASCFSYGPMPRLTALLRDEPPATMAGARFPNSKGWPRATEKPRRNGARPFHPSVSADGSDKGRGERTRISFAGMPAHRVRDTSAAGAIPRSKDLEGEQSPGRVGRWRAGNGACRYGLICGATPRRWSPMEPRHGRRRRQRRRRVDRDCVGSEHQGGNGRGDTKRLRVGGILRRV